MLRLDGSRVAYAAQYLQRRCTQSASTNPFPRDTDAQSQSFDQIRSSRMERKLSSAISKLDKLATMPREDAYRKLRYILDDIAEVKMPLYNTPTVKSLRHDLGQGVEKLIEQDNRPTDLSVEAAVLCNDFQRALYRLSTLVKQHSSELENLQKMADEGQYNYQRHQHVHNVLYRACRAVFQEGKKRVRMDQLAERFNAPSAHEICSWLWAHPLTMAMAQPVFPKVCQSLYTIITALPDPAAHAAALRSSLNPSLASRITALIAVAFANRRAPETGARLIQEAEQNQLSIPERAIRRVMRVLVDSHGRRVIISGLIKLLDAKGVLQCEPPTHRVIALYHAEYGERQLLKERIRILKKLGADGELLRQHTDLMLAAYDCDPERIIQQYFKVHQKPLEFSIEDPTAPEIGLYIFNVIRAYANQDDLLNAQKWFAKFTAFRPVTESMCHILLQLTRRHAHAEVALQLVAEMDEAQVRISSSTLAHLVHTLGAANLPERAASVAQFYARRGVKLDRRVYAALLDAYLEAGHWSAVFGIFRWMRAQTDASLHPDAATYTTMLKAHILRGTPLPKVLHLLHTMRRHGLVPDERAYALVLQSACDAQELQLAQELFDLLDNALKPSLGGATQYHYTILLHALLQHGDLRNARRYMDRMRKDGVEPSHATYNVIMREYAAVDVDTQVASMMGRQLAYEARNRIRKDYPKRSIRQGSPYDSALLPIINWHGRQGELEAAQEVFNDLCESVAPEPVSIRAWTVILNAHRYCNDISGVLRVWDDLYLSTLERTAAQSGKNPGLHQKGILCPPLSVVISACSEAGHFRRIAAIWAQVKKQGFAFDSQNFNHLAAALARANRIREALQVIDVVLPNRAPALERETHAAPPIDTLEEEEVYRKNPLHQQKAKHTEGPFEPRTTQPVRKNRILRSNRDPQSQNLNVKDIQQALFEDVETRDAGEMDDSPWIDNAILIQSDKWFASYNTLREVSEAIDRLQDAPTRRRLRASPPPEAGASALASPAETFASVSDALNEFPTAAKRLAEYEQRAVRHNSSPA
ncbi:hypothetical protein MPSI1_000229 [Malassezia psittaci]|uniref:Pentatricopeptide repeat-containing protein-mitochondrial domain-containing protein n=1 Tax=Malassezia psittaci TaxID=1821823 RepID=A0AAF0F2W1_9BASI|nr:hypothetical protein MPSI1_000229 [Malassezia psittaci]